MLSRVLILAAVSLATSSAVQGQSDAPRDDHQAIRELIASVEAANNAGDVARWVGLFARDFVYLASSAPAVTSRDSLVEVAKAGFRHKAAVRIQPIEIKVKGDWAYARNAVSGSVTLARSGQVVTVDVKQLAVYTRESDGQWRIARLMSNSNR